jgi:hypothetical protein
MRESIILCAWRRRPSHIGYIFPFAIATSKGSHSAVFPCDPFPQLLTSIVLTGWGTKRQRNGTEGTDHSHN